MKSREKVQCHLCTRWLAKPANLKRHLKKVHGIDIEAKRQILLTDGEYRCSLIFSLEEMSDLLIVVCCCFYLRVMLHIKL